MGSGSPSRWDRRDAGVGRDPSRVAGWNGRASGEVAVRCYDACVATSPGPVARAIVAHPIVRVRSFEIVGPYSLRVLFDDGTAQAIDFEPVLAGELYGPLRDPDVFRSVRLDPEAHTLVWPNGRERAAS